MIGNREVTMIGNHTEGAGNLSERFLAKSRRHAQWLEDARHAQWHMNKGTVLAKSAATRSGM
jgi:hypothetical protein